MSDACKMAAIAVSSIVGTLALSVGVFAFYDKYLRNSPDGKNLKPGTSDVDKLKNNDRAEAEEAIAKSKSRAREIMNELNIKDCGCGHQDGFTCYGHAASAGVNWFRGLSDDKPIKDSYDVIHQCFIGRCYDRVGKIENGQIVFKADVQNAVNALISHFPGNENRDNVKEEIEDTIRRGIIDDVVGEFHDGLEVGNILIHNKIANTQLKINGLDREMCKDECKSRLCQHFEVPNKSEVAPIAINVSGAHWITIMCKSGNEFVVYDSSYGDNITINEEDLVNRIVTTRKLGNELISGCDMVIPMYKCDNENDARDSSQSILVNSDTKECVNM